MKAHGRRYAIYVEGVSSKRTRRYPTSRVSRFTMSRLRSAQAPFSRVSPRGQRLLSTLLRGLRQIGKVLYQWVDSSVDSKRRPLTASWKMVSWTERVASACWRAARTKSERMCSARLQPTRRREQINDDGEIKPAGAGGDEGDIGRPSAVRSSGSQSTGSALTFDTVARSATDWKSRYQWVDSSVDSKR